MITIEQLVPKDHLVRKLESAIDFSFIYPLVEWIYNGSIVTPGNVHDSHMLQPPVEKIMEKVKKPLAVAAMQLIKHLRLLNSYLNMNHSTRHKHTHACVKIRPSF